MSHNFLNCDFVWKPCDFVYYGGYEAFFEDIYVGRMGVLCAY